MDQATKYKWLKVVTEGGWNDALVNQDPGLKGGIIGELYKDADFLSALETFYILDMVKHGAIIGEDLIIEVDEGFGHFGCVWHQYSADGSDSDGGTASMLHSYSVERKYFPVEGSILRKVVKK